MILSHSDDVMSVEGRMSHRSRQILHIDKGWIMWFR